MIKFFLILSGCENYVIRNEKSINQSMIDDIQSNSENTYDLHAGMPIQCNPIKKFNQIDQKFDNRYRDFGNRSHDLQIHSNRQYTKQKDLHRLYRYLLQLNLV